MQLESRIKRSSIILIKENNWNVNIKSLSMLITHSMRQIDAKKDLFFWFLTIIQSYLSSFFNISYETKARKKTNIFINVRALRNTLKKFCLFVINFRFIQKYLKWIKSHANRLKSKKSEKKLWLQYIFEGFVVKCQNTI